MAKANKELIHFFKVSCSSFHFVRLVEVKTQNLQADFFADPRSGVGMDRASSSDVRGSNSAHGYKHKSRKHSSFSPKLKGLKPRLPMSHAYCAPLTS